MLGEWIIVKSISTGQDTSSQCPFCDRSKEVSGDWQVLTFDDESPLFDPKVGMVPLDENYVMEAPAYGFCKTIIMSRKHDKHIENLDDEQLNVVFREYSEV